MGGFVFSSATPSFRPPPIPSQELEESSKSPDRCRLNENEAEDRSRSVMLAHQLLGNRRASVIARLPSISEAEIHAKSKGDAFVKGIAILQVLWFIIQIIIRATKQLPVSQLEIAVLSFSACAFVIYCLNWSKPQGVETPFVILVGDVKHQNLLHTSNDSDISHGGVGRLSVHDDAYTSTGLENVSEAEDRYYTYGLVLTGFAFGALHCLARNYEFPTSIEKLLWRVAALITVLGPVLLLGLRVVPNSWLILMYIGEPTMHRFTNFIIMLYILARLYLMVEVFRSLFYLPPEAFVMTWSSGIPHIA